MTISQIVDADKIIGFAFEFSYCEQNFVAALESRTTWVGGINGVGGKFPEG